MQACLFWAPVQQPNNPPSSDLLSVRAQDALPLSDCELLHGFLCVVVFRSGVVLAHPAAAWIRGLVCLAWMALEIIFTISCSVIPLVCSHKRGQPGLPSRRNGDQ